MAKTDKTSSNPAVTNDDVKTIVKVDKKQEEELNALKAELQEMRESLVKQDKPPEVVQPQKLDGVHIINQGKKRNLTGGMVFGGGKFFGV